MYISKQTFIFPFNRQREFKLQVVYISLNTNKVETSWRPTLEMAMWNKHMFQWRLQEPAQTIKEQVNQPRSQGLSSHIFIWSGSDTKKCLQVHNTSSENRTNQNNDSA